MADVFLGSVYANLELRNVDGLNREIDKATGAMGGFRDTALGVFAGNLLTQGFNELIRGVSLFAKTGIEGAANLESGMSLLQKVTGATASEMEKFGKIAIDLGNDLTLPGISASDASDAMIELGKAGLSVNDVMAASKGVLQAATASQISVADSAGLVAGSLQAFGLKGERAVEVADLLAAAANASSLDLDQVGFALNQAGAQASIAGLSINETVGIIAQMANAGIRAQQAGTSLSYMLRQLMSPTQKAKDVMSELGLKVYDASGNFIGIRATIEQLNEKTKNLTQEQKANALSTLFGAEAVKAANVVMEQGVGAFDKMQVAISKTGAAQDLAGARMKGLNGAIESFKNAFETTAVQIGQLFLPALTALTKFVTENIQPVLGALAGLLIGAGVAAVVSAGGFGVLGAAIWTAMAPILPFIAIGAALGAGLVLLDKQFGIFKITMDAVVVAFNFVKDVLTNVWNAVQVLATGDFKGGIFGMEEDDPFIVALIETHKVLKQIAQFIGGQFKSAWDSLVVVFNNAYKALKPFLDPLIEFYQKHAEQINKVLIGIGVALAVVLSPIGGLVLAFGALVAVITVVAVVVNAVSKVFEFLSNTFIAVRDAIVKFFTQTATEATNFGTSVGTVFTNIGNAIGMVFNGIMAVYNATLKPVFDGIIWLVTQIGTIVWTVFSGIATVIYTVVSTIVQIIGVILYGVFKWFWDNALVPFGKAIADTWNFVMGKVNEGMEFVKNVIMTGWNIVWGIIEPIITNIRNTIGNAWNNISATISNVINGIKSTVQAGFNVVRDNIIKPIQDGYNEVVKFVQKFLDAGKNIIDGMVRGVTNGKDAVVNKIKDICAGALDAVKNFFGIHSPSTVMAKMFGYVMKGGELGLEKGAGSFLSTFDNIFNQLPSVDLDSAFNASNMNAAYTRKMSVEYGAAMVPQTNIYGDISVDNGNDQFGIVDQLNRGATLAKKGMTTDV